MHRPDLYNMQLVDKVLCVRLKSIWSKAVVEQVLREVKELVADIRHEPWAAYVDIRDWVMPTMEAWQSFQGIYDWCAEHNQTHEATVCRHQTQQHIIGDVSSYSPEYHVFTPSPKEAEQWLNQRGFTFTLPAMFHQP